MPTGEMQCNPDPRIAGFLGSIRRTPILPEADEPPGLSPSEAGEPQIRDAKRKGLVRVTRGKMQSTRISLNPEATVSARDAR